MKKNVLLAANISNDFHSFLTANEYEIVKLQQGNLPLDVQGIITSTKLKLDKQTLKQFTNLKWIARLGSGLEIIDTAFCKEKNIAVASSPAGIANAVGEHCLAMLVALQKNIASSYSEIKNHIWSREPNRGWETVGDTIGLIGYGHTGQAFANKLKGLDCRIIAYDKFKKGFGNDYIKEVSLKELKQQADVISFHVPANKETFHYYDKTFIENCKPHILMNTSRGDIVYTKDLLEGLQSKSVIGAALDVLENEQFLTDNSSEHWKMVDKLIGHNVIITPHIAGYSHDAIEKMSAELMGELQAIIEN